MKSTIHSARVKSVIAILSFATLAAGAAWGQAAAKQDLTPVLGTVTKVDTTARALTVKTDAGQEYVVNFDAKTAIRKVVAGETDTSKFPVVQIGDVSVNDRVQTRGKVEGQALTATTVFLMARSDVSKSQDAQMADWNKRGVSGLVTAVTSIPSRSPFARCPG